MLTEQVPALKDLCRDIRAATGTDGAAPDPVKTAEALGVRVRYFSLGELKGFYVVLEDIPFIALNRDLPAPLLHIVCAHELGHHLLHRSLAEQTVFNEYDLYRMENKLEREANLFASLFLLPEDPALRLQRPEHEALSLAEAARQLGTTEELLAIRLQAEGHEVGALLSRFPS